MWISFLATICAVIAVQDAEKILLLPFPGGSHVIYFRMIGDDLASRGHEVHMILNPTYPNLKKEQDNPSIKIHVPHHHVPEMYDHSLSKEFWHDYFRQTASESGCVQEFIRNGPMFTAFCTNTLSDDKLFTTLKAEHFDLAVVDGFHGSRCMHVLLYKLGIPHAALSTLYEPWIFRAPALPSFVPFMLGTPYTEDMGLWERLSNTVQLIYWSGMLNIGTNDDALVIKYAPEMPYKPINKLAGQSLIYFQNSDVVLDYARPKMVNVIDTGGLLATEAHPLEEDLEEFVNAAPNGVVVASFGTFVQNFPPEWIDMIMKAFEKLPYSVVFRNPNRSPLEVSLKNVKVMNWIPQNDLLGHEKTLLFMAHCGNNGQFEAIYHAVPLLCIPIFGDQDYNAKRATYRGYARTESILELDPESLSKAIIEVATNTTLKTSIEQASDIFRSRPDTPRARIQYWLEHILKYGGLHMRSHAVNMKWSQYLMLDLLLIALLAIHVIMIVILIIVKQLTNICIPKSKLKTQ